jgi:hypothetical protein
MPSGNDLFPKSQRQSHNHLTFQNFLEKNLISGLETAYPPWMYLKTVTIACVHDGFIFVLCRKIKTISKFYGYLLGGFVI